MKIKNFNFLKKFTNKKKEEQTDFGISRFVIISAPRTGSNLLCGALDAHPEIICHYELFHKEAIYHSSKYGDEWISNYNVEKRNKDPHGFLRHIFNCRFGKPAKTIGYKIFDGHNDQLLDELLNDRQVKKIILKRDNWFLAFLSQLEAQKTGVFVITEENKRKANYNFKVEVKLNQFKFYENVNVNFFNKVEKVLIDDHQRYLSLEYSKALDGDNKIKILNFLNVTVDPGLLKLEYKKQNHRELKDRIENYQEILEQFTGTKYEKYIPLKRN
jgi:hypothetical protein